MIPTSALAKFRASLRGHSFCFGEPGYDAARAVPNAMIDRRPVLVAGVPGLRISSRVCLSRASTAFSSRCEAEVTALRGRRFATMVS
jgi:hypothetical protein